MEKNYAHEKGVTTSFKEIVALSFGLKSADEGSKTETSKKSNEQKKGFCQKGGMKQFGLFRKLKLGAKNEEIGTNYWGTISKRREKLSNREGRRIAVSLKN